jgi:hypothetical protein
MDEHVRTVFLLDETVALAAVKPFDDSIRHDAILLPDKFSWFPPAGCHFCKWNCPSERNRPVKPNRPLVIVRNIAGFQKFATRL